MTEIKDKEKTVNVGFIGNPNCGKTTLFNAYTGARLKVANWPGVTVEKKEGAMKYHDHEYKLVDLPGIYSLTSYTMEERLSRQYILDDEVDVIVDVADASIAPNADGSVNAYLKVNSIRPYFGLGVGRAVPKHRVGFRFELGAMYIGKPDVDSPNIDGTLNSEDLDGFNKTLSKCRFYPQLSFKLTYRLFKDK